MIVRPAGEDEHPVLLVFLVLFTAFALIGTGSGSVSVSRSAGVLMTVTAGRSIRTPNVVGRKVCDAILVAQRAGFDVHAPNGPCDVVVVGQKPAPGHVVHSTGSVTLRLRVRR